MGNGGFEFIIKPPQGCVLPIFGRKISTATTAFFYLPQGSFIYGFIWNRDFSLLVGGQFISIFGNMILSFALPLYLLYISGSVTLFGLVMDLTNIQSNAGLGSVG